MSYGYGSGSRVDMSKYASMSLIAHRGQQEADAAR